MESEVLTYFKSENKSTNGNTPFHVLLHFPEPRFRVRLS